MILSILLSEFLACSMPFEYCEYSGMADACRVWATEHAPGRHFIFKYCLKSEFFFIFKSLISIIFSFSISSIYLYWNLDKFDIFSNLKSEFSEILEGLNVDDKDDEGDEGDEKKKSRRGGRGIAKPKVGVLSLHSICFKNIQISVFIHFMEPLIVE